MPPTKNYNLNKFTPAKDFFIGIDSDGCVFDSMELKHKECFGPATVWRWGLQPISKYARETFEFVNLYSKWRGTNRWIALLKVFELLNERPEIEARNFNVPTTKKLQEFVASGIQLSDAGLAEFNKKNPHPELEMGLKWTKTVNKAVEDIVHGMQPFPFVKECFEFLQNKADLVVISSTPFDAILREWKSMDIEKYMNAIAGQETGNKIQQLKMATQSKYPANQMLMIGDAPGDLKAAKSIGALFYPIIPGKEDASWRNFFQEAMHLFLEKKYTKSYENNLIKEFENSLPESPPWI